jgi:predicted XRE-type DNA-binding protein
MKIEVFDSIWDAIEDDPIAARALERRANLMILIRQKIEKGKWSQPEVAKMLGVTRPRVSDLMRGQLSKFSLDTLLTFVERMGDEVHIEVGKPKVVSSAKLRPGKLVTKRAIAAGKFRHGEDKAGTRKRA